MILDAISLENFGIFGGRQEISLTPTSERKPIVLFGGLNGGGKTTLLDAVQLALFGPKAKCSGRGKLAYRDYLGDMIHRGADPALGASVELRFRRAVDGEMRSYRILRSWKKAAKGVEDTMEVTLDAEVDLQLSEHWDEFIESYIPSSIAHLFFFDAEQIKDLAEGEHAAEILGIAIHTLLGLDLVDRLDTDLIVLSRRKRTSAMSNERAAKLRSVQEECERLQNLLDRAQQDHGALGNEADRAAKELAACEAKFRQEGGDLFLLRADLEAERASLQKMLAAEEGSLRELAAGVAPLLWLPGLLDSVEKRARVELKARRSAILFAALEERDVQVMDVLRRNKTPEKNLNTIARFLAADRKDRATARHEPIILDAGDNLAAEIHHLRGTVLPEIKSLIDHKLEKISSVQERITRCDVQLAGVPSEYAIAALQKELNRLRQKHQSKQTELALQEDKVRVVTRQLEDARRKVEREMGQEVDLLVDGESNDRIVSHSARVRETLAKFRIGVIHKHAERLERLVLESFNHLLRKRFLVNALKIDPATFRLELTGSDGKPLPFDRLSAGERQLLATSLLWGLAKASGRPLPTIIDTPLGRLDSSHRRHLVERYFPIASHQVILLSTDEEIDESSLIQLKPHVGRSYTLHFEEQEHRSIIKPGYFWNHESTP